MNFEILPEALAWSCAGPCEKLLWGSCWHPLRGPCSTFSKRSLHDPVQGLNGGSCRDPGGVLSKRSLHEILQMPCLIGACMKAFVGGSWEVFVSRSCKIRSNSSRSFCNDLVSWHEDLGRGLCVILCKSFWEAFEEAPVKSPRCPYMISYRCLWEDLVEILLKSSSTGPCIKILKILCVDACLNVLLWCS